MNDERELEELQHNNANEEDIQIIAKKHAGKSNLTLIVQLKTNVVYS